ncbi:MAG: hypothetical protein H6825_10375, partial [Planctomycetes bacterium]|nr:hypothetical protein [Planctomycetota bacterium]
MASRLTWIVFALGIAIYGMWAKPLVLGLDLRGGVTMRYELEPPPDYDKATLDDMINSTVETLRNRINAYGIRESNITRQGEREILVELPGSSKEEAESVKGLVSRVGRLEFRIVMWDGFRDPKNLEDDTRNGIVMDTEVGRLADLLALPENKGKAPSDLDLSSLEHRIDDQELVYRWYPCSDEMLLENRGIEERMSTEEV